MAQNVLFGLLNIQLEEIEPTIAPAADGPYKEWLVQKLITEATFASKSTKDDSCLVYCRGRRPLTGKPVEADKKGKKKAISNGTSAADGDAAGKEAKRNDDGDTDKKRKADGLSADAEGKEATIKPGTGKNAKKNLKKRQKRNELEKAKAAGML